MILTIIFGVNQDVIQVNNDKNIKVVDQNLIDIALKVGRSVE